jgi:hypothetical protein
MDIQTEQRGFRRKSNRRKAVLLKTITVTMKTRKRMDGLTRRDAAKKLNKTCQTAKIILTRTSNTLYLSRKETTNLQLSRQMKIQRQHRYTMSQILIQVRLKILNAIVILPKKWRSISISLQFEIYASLQMHNYAICARFGFSSRFAIYDFSQFAIFARNWRYSRNLITCQIANYEETQIVRKSQIARNRKFRANLRARKVTNCGFHAIRAFFAINNF